MIGFVLGALLAHAGTPANGDQLRVLRVSAPPAGSDLSGYRVFEIATPHGVRRTTDSINRYLGALRPLFSQCTIEDRRLNLVRFLVLAPADMPPPRVTSRAWRLARITDGNLTQRYLAACRQAIR